MNKQHNWLYISLGILALCAGFSWLFDLNLAASVHIFFVWLPILVGGQTLYGTLVTTLKIEQGLEIPFSRVVKDLGLAFSMLVVAQGSTWRRYGWFDLGSDYLDLWLYINFATVLAVGWQLGYIALPHRRLRSISRALGIILTAGVGLALLKIQLRAPQVLERGWFLEVGAAVIVFSPLLLKGTLLLNKNDTALQAAAELLGLKGLLLALFVVYACWYPPMRTGEHPYLATLPIGIIAASLLASTGIIWRKSR